MITGINRTWVLFEEIPGVVHTIFSDAGTGGAGGAKRATGPSQFLADQLTLFQPGRADYPHLLLLAPPMFFTFRHHCIGTIMEFWSFEATYRHGAKEIDELVNFTH